MATCTAVEQLREEGRSEGIELGRSEGIELGREEMLKMIMRKMNISVEDAMDFLEIPKERREFYKKRI